MPHIRVDDVHTACALAAVNEERDKQNAKWGNPRPGHGATDWSAILTEAVREVVRTGAHWSDLEEKNAPIGSILVAFARHSQALNSLRANFPDFVATLESP